MDSSPPTTAGVQPMVLTPDEQAVIRDIRTIRKGGKPQHMVILVEEGSIKAWPCEEPRLYRRRPLR